MCKGKRRVLSGWKAARVVGWSLVIMGNVWLLSTPWTIRAQPAAVQIEHADELQILESAPPVRKLTGNVRLRQRDLLLMCEQALFYPLQNLVDATGSVLIRHADTVEARGDRLVYNGNLRIAHLTGNTTLTDQHMHLAAPSLTYDLTSRRASYTDGGRWILDSAQLTSQRAVYDVQMAEVLFSQGVQLIHPRFTLSSDSLRFDAQRRIAFFVAPTFIVSDELRVYCEGGYYRLRSEEARFVQQARIKQAGQHLSADTIDYDRRQQILVARSRMTWADSAKQQLIKGHRCQYYQQHGIFWVSDQAIFIAVMNGDSLFLVADTIFAKKVDTPGWRTMSAFPNVQIFKSDLQAVCDSIVYNEFDSTLTLFRKPILWISNNQLVADTISLRFAHNRLDLLWLKQNALIAQISNSTQFNQAKGRNMIGYFHEGALQRMEIIGNAESIYYVEQETGGLIGVNKAVCASMELFFDSLQQVYRIFFIKEPEAVLYPLNQTPEEAKTLTRFRWYNERRPQSKPSVAF